MPLILATGPDATHNVDRHLVEVAAVDLTALIHQAFRWWCQGILATRSDTSQTVRGRAGGGQSGALARRASYARVARGSASGCPVVSPSVDATGAV